MKTPSGFTLHGWYAGAQDFESCAEGISRTLAQHVRPALGELEFAADRDVASQDFTATIDMLIHRPADEWIVLELAVHAHRMGVDEVREALAGIRDAVRTELERGRLRAAELIRQGGEADCFPLVPILRKRHLSVCEPEDPERFYENAEVFRACPGVDFEPIGDRLLVSRAMTAVDDLAFLSLALPQAWILARAAKAGQTVYGLQAPAADEVDIYKSGVPRLEPVGYIEALGLAEYTCFLEPDQEITGWEIERLHRILRDGKFADGRPVAKVRVSFPSRDMAEREKRPLLDGGVEVIFMQAGEEHEITE
jgi:hypothetical protein